MGAMATPRVSDMARSRRLYGLVALLESPVGCRRHRNPLGCDCYRNQFRITV